MPAPPGAGSTRHGWSLPASRTGLGAAPWTPAALTAGHHVSVSEGVGNALQVVRATAPVRVCDNGGWTDTWFAGHGKVCNIAMSPGVAVEIAVVPSGVGSPQVVLDVSNFDDRYGFEIADPPGRHPLLEAAISEIGTPDDVSIEVAVSSAVPAGSSTGTSAAVTVALIGALDALTGGRMGAGAVASAAHRVEVGQLGVESGIQDQLCAVFGGISYIEMASYPDATVTAVPVEDRVWRELEERLLLVYLGRAHDSSAVHRQVIERLASEGPMSPHLESLRHCAEGAKDALTSGDLRAFGEVMKENTTTQSELHPALVGEAASRVMEIAADQGAWGWKVNGAGGDGGSVTLLCASAEGRQHLSAVIRDADRLFDVLPSRLCRLGLQVWSE